MVRGGPAATPTTRARRDRGRGRRRRGPGIRPAFGGVHEGCSGEVLANGSSLEILRIDHQFWRRQDPRPNHQPVRRGTVRQSAKQRQRRARAEVPDPERPRRWSWLKKAITVASLLCVVVGLLGASGMADAPAGGGTVPRPTWTRLIPATNPTARYYASTAYDPSMGRLVLFGGTHTGGNLADTWTWTAQRGRSSPRPPAPQPATWRRWPTTRPAVDRWSSSGAYYAPAPAATPGPGTATHLEAAHPGHQPHSQVRERRWA